MLLLVATLIHLDKFDLDSIFGWFWLIVYCAVPPVLAVLVWAQVRGAGAAPPPGRPDTRAAACRAAAPGAVMGGIGGVMYVEPSTARTCGRGR